VTGTDVVVTDYRTPDDLEGFLQSFEECRAPEDRLHIMLVDPKRESTAVVKPWLTHPALASYETFDTNVGYGTACNVAAENAGAFEPRPVLALFNADTRLAPGITKQCADALLANPDWGVLGPRQIDDAGRLTHAGITGTNEHCEPRAWRERDRGQHHQAEAVISVSGSAYFIKRQVWDELRDCPYYLAWLALNRPATETIGAFLPTPLYYEETWCSYHTRAHGWKVVYFGHAQMVHRWHKAVEAAGHGEPTAKYHEAAAMFHDCCDHHGIAH
jgi:GT2 family glycosyltransferase